MMNPISFAVLLLTLTVYSCKQKDNITGKWNFGKVTTEYPPNPPMTTDASDSAFVGSTIRNRVPASVDPGTMIAKAMDCHFRFNSDSTFGAYDIGFVYHSQPGVFLGKAFDGRWRMTNDSTIVVEGIGERPQIFTIVSKSTDSLVLGAYPQQSGNYSMLIRLYKKR